MAIQADKHMNCMNKAQRENEVVIIFQLLSERGRGLDSFQMEGRLAIGNTPHCFSERKTRRSEREREDVEGRGVECNEALQEEGL